MGVATLELIKAFRGNTNDLRQEFARLKEKYNGEYEVRIKAVRDTPWYYGLFGCSAVRNGMLR